MFWSLQSPKIPSTDLDTQVVDVAIESETLGALQLNRYLRSIRWEGMQNKVLVTAIFLCNFVLKINGN